MHTLIEYLKKVKDFRLDQGQRHQLWFILLIVILGLMTGYLGSRSFGDVAKYQQRHLTKYFRMPRRKVPSSSTIRRATIQGKWANLIEIFNQWASHYTKANDESESLTIDGKSLRYTLDNYGRHQPKFLSINSVFCQDNGLVLHLQKSITSISHKFIMFKI